MTSIIKCLLTPKSLSLLATSVAAATLATNLMAANPLPRPQAIMPAVVIPSAPSVAAKSWILMDANSGHVITEHNADTSLPPASLTKLMTAYLIEREIDQGNLSLDDDVLISEKAWKKGGSKMFIEVGKKVSVDDLLHGIIIVSGNDASIAMAEHLAGSEEAFAGMMNQQAQRLGLYNTYFENATGWPSSNHTSSARDMALLSQHIINDYPEHYALYSQREFSYNDISQRNRNKLLWRDASADGLKTGWTQEAGYGLVASAKRDNMRLISVVFGAKSPEARTQEVQKMLSYGFRYFDTITPVTAGSVLGESVVWGGVANSVRAGLNEDVVFTIPKHQVKDVTQKAVFDEDLTAPIQAGDVLGRLTITVGDELLGERNIVAMDSVEEGGFFKRVFDGLKRFFTNLF